MTRRQNLSLDILISLLLIGLTYLYAMRFVDFSVPPFEDAAMLMRYADHLAHGYGIVWNIGEKPVDGATDFLFMVSVAGLIKTGMTVGRAVRGLGYASHLLAVLLTYWVNRRLWGANVVVSIFSALYLAVGTGLSYVAAYFGTPFFALAVSVTWIFGLLLIRRPDQPLWLCSVFSMSGLVVGLIRPEGVILAVLMLLSVVLLRGLKNSGVLIAFFLGIFLLIGSAYFMWRWNYFGYPLPNPFYKKGAGGLHWDSFVSSFLNTLRLILPLLLAFMLGLRKKETARLVFASLIPILGFAALFILISDETNYGARFQYATLPIALISWYPLVRGLIINIQQDPGEASNGLTASRDRFVYSIAGMAIAAGLIFYSWHQNCYMSSFQASCLTPYESDGRYDMGKILADYRGKGYVMATTEAGLLPYYSGWTAIDTWGLNDPWIVHNGEITEEYLDKYRPQIIAFHAYFSPIVPPKLTEINMSQDWFRMTITLKQYAEARGYLLAAVFGDSPYDTHYYYVRADFADSHRIFQQISSMQKYYWFSTGKKSLNYANLLVP